MPFQPLKLLASLSKDHGWKVQTRALQGEAANREGSGEHHAQATGKHQQHHSVILPLCIEHLPPYPFSPHATDLRGWLEGPWSSAAQQQLGREKIYLLKKKKKKIA